MDTSDESSSTHLPWSQPFISFTGSSSSSFDLTPGGNNNGNNNDNVISSRTNNHSNNLYNNDHCTQWLPSSKQSQQLDPRITNNVLLQYNNNENNNDDENSNGNIDLSRKRNHDSLINDERYLDSVEFDSSLYDDVVIDPSIFDTVHQYNQLPSQSSIESKGDSPNYIGGSVMLVISQQCSEDTASLFRHAINIFVPDKTSHTAKCVVAFFEDNPLYSILQVSCSSMEEWRSNNADHNAETTHLSHLQKRFKNIIEKGSEVLTRLENEDNDEESQSSQEETSLSFLTTISNDLKIQDAASKRVEINGQLSPEQIVTACELLDELYLKAVEAVMSEHTIGLPYINNAKMVGVIEKVDIFIYSRILHLNYTLRKRLGERLDNNTTQELKYCLEEVYEGYSDKYGCLNRDLERLCKHLNITPCALGATTTPLRRAYGAFAEVTKDEDVIDWNVSQNADGGLGRLVTTRYRNHLDDIENDIVALRPTNGDIKCILYTEDLATFKAFRHCYERLQMIVCHTKGFSDRNIRGFIKYCSTIFPNAIITGMVDMDLFGLRQIQANSSNECLTRNRNVASNYSFESHWIGPYPSMVEELLKSEPSKVSTTQMSEAMAMEVRSFIDKSSFPVSGNNPPRRQTELKKFYDQRKICKMEQIDHTYLFDAIIARIESGDYGI